MNLFKYALVVKLILEGKVEHLNKKVSELLNGQITMPKQSSKWKGTSIGRDKNGYFCCTHRARTKSYESPDDIPLSKIKRIKSTG